MEGLQLSMGMHRKLLQDANMVHQNGLTMRASEIHALDLSGLIAWTSSSPMVCCPDYNECFVQMSILMLIRFGRAL